MPNPASAPSADSSNALPSLPRPPKKSASAPATMEPPAPARRTAPPPSSPSCTDRAACSRENGAAEPAPLSPPAPRGGSGLRSPERFEEIRLAPVQPTIPSRLFLFPCVNHVPDRTRAVISNEQGTVVRHRHAHRPPPYLPVR